MSVDRFLITGGAGFIGSNIAAELVKRGHDVAIFDNFSTGRRENLEKIERDIEIIPGDLRDADAVKKAATGRTFILHQAALPSVSRSVQDPLATNEVNVAGTLNLLVAARDVAVRRVVLASSSSVYGDTPSLPKVETMPVLPMSPYAVSKLAAEKYAAAFFKVYGLETVALRYFNVFGPRQDPTSQYSAVIPRFITAIMRGEQPTVYGDGLQSRDFTFVANVIEANLLACHSPNVAGEFFNVACGQRFTLLELLTEICQIMDKRMEPRHEAARPGDVRHSLADVSKLRAATGYEAKIGFREGLERTIQHFMGASS
ncbi:SDR family oxidoreductase [bacterium]|nr:SDR family oxidoreductase [bacterium]MBU1984000.1 SDR family oxidoreductase [bacterium]